MQDAARSEPPKAADVQALLVAAAALRGEGRLADAEAALKRAAEFAPGSAQVFADLGFVYNLMSRGEDAEASYRRALELDPADVRVLSNLAGTLQVANRHAEAETLYRRALELQPAFAPALLNLGALTKNSARIAESKSLYRRALATAPGLEATIQAHLALSPTVRSQADIAWQRESYREGLEALAAQPGAFAYAGENLNLPWYYLAYHGEDDRQLLARTVEVLRQKIQGLGYVAPHVATPTAPGSARRIRVGFCSQFLRGHTIGHLFGGFLRHLDRSRFEVVLIHGAQSFRNEIRDAFDQQADRVVMLDPQLGSAQRQIAELALDVLIYPDIGMSAQTWLLAQARLAPVQAVSWGHPDTTGVQTLDYFLSCDGVETPGAEAFYTERLVRMNRLPSCYARPAPGPVVSREELRLPPSGALYGCPQTAFKFHPDFDAVLFGVLDQDPTGHVILIRGHITTFTEVLRARWAALRPDLLPRLHVLPQLNHPGFMAHLAHLDVLLDPLHFGSGNTLYEGVATGTPIVTLPGRFARARIVAAAYAQMGIAEAPVATSVDDYISLAVGLARDPARRAALSRRLEQRAEALFEDRGAVRELEAFLEAATAAAARHELLPPGWRPPLPDTAP